MELMKNGADEDDEKMELMKNMQEKLSDGE